MKIFAAVWYLTYLQTRARIKESNIILLHNMINEQVRCLERDRADLLALVCDVYCDFVTFPFGILGQVWHLIVSIPDPCCLSYFDVSDDISEKKEYFTCFKVNL